MPSAAMNGAVRVAEGGEAAMWAAMMDLVYPKFLVLGVTVGCQKPWQL